MEDQSKDTGTSDQQEEDTCRKEEEVQHESEKAGTNGSTAVAGLYHEENVEKNKESTDDLEQSIEVEMDPAVIEKLTHSVLEMFLPNLQKAKGSLNEVLHNQEVLIETIQQENSKFTESAPMKELLQTMLEAKVYHSKLVNLKREMNALMDKSTKLKRKAVKLQQQKQKEELTRADQRERELERERMLMAKVAKPTPKPDS